MPKLLKNDRICPVFGMFGAWIHLCSPNYRQHSESIQYVEPHCFSCSFRIVYCSIALCKLPCSCYICSGEPLCQKPLTFKPQHVYYFVEADTASPVTYTTPMCNILLISQEQLLATLQICIAHVYF